MAYIIKRSAVGTYHIGSNGCDHVNCNQRLRAKPAKRSDVEKAGAHMFCEKCFSQKPEGERLEYFFPQTQGA